MGLLAETLDYVSQGGAVMIPLALVSMAMWALIAERTMAMRRLGRHDIGPGEEVRILRHGTIPEGASGLGARVLARFLEERSGDRGHDLRLLDECVMKERPGLTRNLAVIAALAAVAPLLGLLGTVMGMITTFDVLSVFGTGNARALAGGISEALITTQSGLLIAIPGLSVSALLTRRAHRLDRRLEEIRMSLRGGLLREGVEPGVRI